MISLQSDFTVSEVLDVNIAKDIATNLITISIATKFNVDHPVKLTDQDFLQIVKALSAFKGIYIDSNPPRAVDNG